MSDLTPRQRARMEAAERRQTPQASGAIPEPPHFHARTRLMDPTYDYKTSRRLRALYLAGLDWRTYTGPAPRIRWNHGANRWEARPDSA